MTAGEPGDKPPRKNPPEIRASAQLTYEAEEERTRAAAIFECVVDEALATRPEGPEARKLVRRMVEALRAVRAGVSAETFVLQQEQ